MTVDTPIIGLVGQYIVPLALSMVILIVVRRLWYEYLIQNRDPAFDAPLPDGSMGWPLIGETISFALQGSEFYEKKFQQHGRLFKTHLFGRPTVRVRGAENIRKILHGENDIVTSYWPATSRLIFGTDCLSQSQGPFHTRLRKHVASAFSHTALAGYVSLVQPLIIDAIDDWCKAPAGVTAYPECRSLTFRVSGKVLCGFDYSKEETASLIDHFEDIFQCLFTLPINIPGSTLNKGLKARDLIAKKITENIQRKMDDDDTQDALRILMEQDMETGEIPSTSATVCRAIDLLVAGYASTASAACSIIRQLHDNKHVLIKVRRELKDHNMTQPGSPLTLQDMNQLKYVSNVIKETMRMSPPIGAAFRKALRTFELDGKQIPAGWTVLYSIRETVGSSDIFADRNNFDPDRFASERCEDRSGDRYNYCIFGGGPRSCIGKSFAVMLMRMLVIELARSCNWELLKPESVKINQLPTPHPVDGMPVRFTALNNVDHNANSVVFSCESEENPDAN
ncbi:cytochrome P450 26A1-like [Acanthaster planci]|uniref:Cytochrome P450 26A1-like n=1 Tax=Acanthaster planci TaxID=133434 RepID=A0A8B7YTL6_ACAPL|nr:cytochrome P450 26A1-like [Acanthaster planci]XP_022096634.1 cytochrome P450 26A1-like [Acanthaster planci]